MTVFIFLFIIALLVLIHEFGHFFAAKKIGVLVEEFGLGFPPRLIAKKIGETLYSLNIFPLGGFVKLYGEENHEVIKDKKLASRAFINKKPLQKLLVIVAGVSMNLILAVFIYYFLLSSNNFVSEEMPMFGKYKFRFGTQQGKVIVADVTSGSPAKSAGIESEDSVIRFRSVKNSAIWTDIVSSNQLISLIKNKAGEKIEIEFKNIKNGKIKKVEIVPYYNKDLKRAIIGASLIDAVEVKYKTEIEKLLSGPLHSYNIMAYNVYVMKDLISSSFKEKKLGPVAQTVSGPIGIFGIVDDMVKSSGKKLFFNILNVLALLNLSLGFINILPLPALDGGRAIFVFYEMITKKPANKNIEKYVNLIGFISLLFLGILVSINDIVRLFR